MSLLRIAIGFCLAVVALLAVKAVAQSQPAAQPPVVERIGAGVTAAGQDVSGLTVEEAAARLQGVHGERLERGSVTVRAAGLTWRLTPAKARVRFDPMGSAKRAMDAGRSSQGAPVDVPLVVEYSKARVERFAGRIDRRLRRKPRDAQLRVSLMRVRVARSRRGRDIDGRQLARDIGQALRDPRVARVFKPKLLRPKPKITAGELRRRATTVITIHQATLTLRLLKNSTVVRSYKVAVGQPGYSTRAGSSPFRASRSTRSGRFPTARGRASWPARPSPAAAPPTRSRHAGWGSSAASASTAPTRATRSARARHAAASGCTSPTSSSCSAASRSALPC